MESVSEIRKYNFAIGGLCPLGVALPPDSSRLQRKTTLPACRIYPALNYTDGRARVDEGSSVVRRFTGLLSSHPILITVQRARFIYAAYCCSGNYGNRVPPRSTASHLLWISSNAFPSRYLPLLTSNLESWSTKSWKISSNRSSLNRWWLIRATMNCC